MPTAVLFPPSLGRFFILINKASRLSVLALLLFASFNPVRAAGIDDIRKNFERPPSDARIMMRWWWFGPAVTKPEIERELRVMKAGGIGGVEVQPVYPLLPDDPQNG